MQPVRKHRLIWADVVALVVAAIILVAFGFGWLLAVLSTGLAGAGHVFAGFFLPLLEVTLAVAGGAWIVLRLIDLMFHGATYRLLTGRDARHEQSSEESPPLTKRLAAGHF